MYVGEGQENGEWNTDTSSMREQRMYEDQYKHLQHGSRELDIA
jgi:hypothetical protein